MNKILKIALNILIFAVIAGFGYYMIRSMNSDNRTRAGEQHAESTFVSPYTLVNSFEFNSDVICFDVFDDEIYAVLTDRISVSSGFDYPGGTFADVRDFMINNDGMYLLFPTKIELYNFAKQRESEWNACSDNADYVAMTTSKNYIFVTDAANKNIVQYDRKGNLVRFIKSPEGFIIPSHTFDIININDTIYVSNSGRHQIESYTLDGEFISSFGKSGSQAGAFAGCCNPVFLAVTSGENILTSEKGNPRISSYGKDGKFRSILFDATMLGGGTNAYRMKVSDDHIYIANKKTVSVYGRNILECASATGNSCKNSCSGCPNRK